MVGKGESWERITIVRNQNGQCIPLAYDWLQANFPEQKLHNDMPRPRPLFNERLDWTDATCVMDKSH